MKVKFIYKALLLLVAFIMYQSVVFAQNSNCISSVKASGWQIFEQNNVGIGAITTAVYFGVNNSLPTLTYKWFVNSVDENQGGILLPYATSSKYVPSSSTIGTFYYYCVVSGGAGACGLNSNVSNTVKIEVKPLSNSFIQKTHN